MAKGDYRQSWERVPEGPKPEGPPPPPSDRWREYVEPCPDSGREHDCTFDYIMRWEVGQFLAWSASVRADAWDEGRKSTIEDGPDGSILVSFGDKPNPYRSEKQ